MLRAAAAAAAVAAAAVSNMRRASERALALRPAVTARATATHCRPFASAIGDCNMKREPSQTSTVTTREGADQKRKCVRQKVWRTFDERRPTRCTQQAKQKVAKRPSKKRDTNSNAFARPSRIKKWSKVGLWCLEKKCRGKFVSANFF